jgi:hypothetical protein
MKMHPNIHIAAIVFIAGVCLQGCAVPATATPAAATTAADTSTSMPTVTSTIIPTSTRMPTATHAPAPTNTHAPTSACNIVDSEWGSEEVVETTWTTTPFPMVQFHVGNCHISRFTLVTYPAKGKLFETEFLTNSGEIRNGLYSESFDNPDGPGALSIFGKFTTHERFQGSLMFSKGFQVGEYILPDTVTIPFNATLALRD